MTARPSAQRREYIARINRVVDYVWAHFDQELCYEELADIARFSRFHFHRVFSSIMGETLTDFIRRVRLERAAAKLLADLEVPVTNVALDGGFSSPSVFARAFKERFGMSATTWRQRGGSRHGKICKANSNQGQALRKPCEAPRGEAPYDDIYNSSPRRPAMRKLKYTVEVKTLDPLHVAYIRHVGPYNEIDRAFARLMTWAGPRGLLSASGARVLAIYHDNPEVTEASKLQSSACVSVPPGTVVGNDVGEMDVPGGVFAVGHFEIDGSEFKQAWDALLGEWLPSSGYQPDDRMCYEVYLNDHETHPEKKFKVDICEPIKPL